MFLWDMQVGGLQAQNIQRTGFEEAHILKDEVDLDVIKFVAFQNLKEKWAAEIWTDQNLELTV